MGKHQDFLEEEREEQNQPLIRLLRAAYRPGRRDARSMAHMRQRLLSGDYQRADGQQHESDNDKNVLRIGSMNSYGSAPHPTRLPHWRRSLAIIAAAAFAIVLVISSLFITLNLIRRPSPAAPPIVGTAQTPTAAPAHTLTPAPSARTQTGVKSIRMIDSSTGWIFCADGSVLRSRDGGLNWADVTPSALLASRQAEHMGVGSLFQDASTAWIVVVAGNVGTALTFSTHDGGQTWQEGTVQAHVVLATTAPTYDITATSAQEAWVMAMNDGTPASGSAQVVAQREGNLFHTTDGGKTWTQMRSYPTTSVGCPPAIRFADQRTAIITGSTGNAPAQTAVSLTVDGGARWQTIPVHSPDTAHWKLSMICSPQFLSAQDGIFVAAYQNASPQAGKGASTDRGFSVFSTHDGGHTWNSSPIVDAGDASCVSEQLFTDGRFFDILHGYVLCSVGQSGGQRLYTTGDGGQHWQTKDLKLPAKAVGDIVDTNFISVQQGWALLASPAYVDSQIQPTSLYMTVDGGQSWTQVYAHFPSFITPKAAD